MSKGWTNESARHSMSAYGIKTGTKKKDYYTTDKLSVKQKNVIDKYENGVGKNDNYKGYEISELKKVFDEYHDKDNWKNPVEAIFEVEDANVVPHKAQVLMKAIEFYQGVEPKIVYSSIAVYPHKDALTKVWKNVYIVKSAGYGCD